MPGPMSSMALSQLGLPSSSLTAGNRASPMTAMKAAIG